MGVEMSIKMSPKQAGKLYQKAMKMEKQLATARAAYIELTNRPEMTDTGAPVFLADKKIMDKFDEALGV